MIHRVRRHGDVERDILDLASWIARDSRETAIHFFEAVEESIKSLRSMPGRGSPKRLRSPKLANIRSLAVRGFPNHLILYEVIEAEVAVYLIVHGARRYPKLLRDRLPSQIDRSSPE